MGPGLLIKSLLRGSFSLLIFGWSQIVIDVQPLVVLIRGAGTLHGISHTYGAATVIALFAALSGKWLVALAVKVAVVQREGFRAIAWRTAMVSALIGAYSHVALDSFMHGDMAPFYPLALSNNLHGALTADVLHAVFLYSGIAGVVTFYAVGYIRQWRRR